MLKMSFYDTIDYKSFFFDVLYILKSVNYDLESACLLYSFTFI